MEEPDFSDVDPLRVPEARRRIAAIRSYLALAQPTTVDAIRIGRSIGLSRWRFVRLVAVWQAHRDAKLLVLDRRNDSGPASTIDPVATAIVEEVARKYGPDAKLPAIVAQIRSRCADVGVQAPSQPTIWRQLRKMQVKKDLPDSGPPRIVIGRMWFLLPVLDQTDAKPMALVAVMLPERLIVGHRVAVDSQAPPSIGDLIAELAERHADGAAPRPLLIDVEDRRNGADQLELSGLATVRPWRRSLQIEISRAFGGRLGQIKAIYKRKRVSTKKLKIRQAQPLTRAEAIDAIENAISAHNAAIATDLPQFAIAEMHADPDGAARLRVVDTENTVELA